MASRYSIQLFFGTWCGDSKREVPRMLKVLYQSGFKDTAIDLIAVSNHDTLYKQSPLHEERGLNIIRVPTLIVYQSGKEIGRIVETPVESIEKDIWQIVQRRNYLHKNMTN
jgi:thiol-disulfide isomerase/thioredoxin